MATQNDGRDDHVEMGATRARQGRYGRHMFWVLAISTVAAVIALVASWAFRAGDLASTEPNNATQVQDAQAYDAPAPAPKQTEPQPPG